MVHIKKNSPKDFAIELRKGGYSYSEIMKFCPVPKSTLSYWFRDLKLSEPQLLRLKKKRIESAQKGSKTKILKTAKDKTEIIVSFLALLELMKQRVIVVKQTKIFDDITIKRL